MGMTRRSGWTSTPHKAATTGRGSDLGSFDMRKWLWRITWGTSLICAMLIATLWIACPWRIGSVMFRLNADNMIWADSEHGCVVVGYFADDMDADQFITIQWLPTLDGSFYRRQLDYRWKYLGIGYSDANIGIQTHVVEFPLAYLLALAFFLSGVAWWRSRQTNTAHTCPKCGYDLRASTITCPECGTPIPPIRHSDIRH